MNSGITSKDAILLVCRKIVAEQGLSALNMRTVAKACGIALGTLYNYFSDKDELLIATVESVWRNIFHRDENHEMLLPFPDYVADLFCCVRNGAAKYPNFLTAHSLSIAKGKKGEAKSAMEQCFVHMKAGLLEVLRADPLVGETVFSGALSESDFVDFVMDNLLLLLVKEKPNCAALVELVRQVIYR